MQHASAEQQHDEKDMRKPFQCPLPGNDALWDTSTLKSPRDWPQTLQALSTTLSIFEYPAAIFWGKNLTLLYNAAWETAGGIREQGQAQREALSSDASRALSKCIDGGKPSKIESHALLREEEKQDGKSEVYTVLASPVFGDDDDLKPAGVLAQMMQVKGQEDSSSPPSSPSNNEQAEKVSRPNDGDGVPDLQSLGERHDNVPFNKHPFFRRFAEMLPTGLAILDHEAKAVFVNQHFYELTTHLGEDKSFKSWPQSIHPDDYERVLDSYHEAFTSKKQLRTEFRALGKEHPWRLLLLTPLGDENLRHVSLAEYGGFICSVVDITSEKSAELTQRHAAEEAVERKQQQERFIDMISHEIRNPLSAVLHCVEDIDDVIKAGKEDHGAVHVEQISEALETINLCISHQKNIVDDVLSYSKLDSSMLTLTPRPTQISAQIRRSLKMFQPEFRKKNLDFEYCIDDGYTSNKLDWVMADLPRIGQVLVNLVSNSIKFTVGKRGARRITCRLSASHERPTSYPPDVVLFNTDHYPSRPDATEREEWGKGEGLYAMVAITDTGIGISDDGQKRLFERFEQATPKTSQIYGGSGLGLNISRKIVHLHGGEIGVASKEGEGTTFGFFFRVRRCGAPEDVRQSHEEDEDDEQRMRSQINARGLESLNNGGDEEAVASLKDPQVKSTEEWDFDDGRAEHSSRLAREFSHEHEGDEKGDSTQPNSTERKEHEQDNHRKGQEDQDAEEGKQQTDQGVTSNAHSSTPSQLPLRRRPQNSTTKPHVLLVEDNIINQRIVHRKLTARGFLVTTASNGREGVDIYSASFSSMPSSPPIDTILMDQEMPILDGNGASREIREWERREGRGERVPILGVSANVRSEQLRSMVESGMDGVLTKPYGIEEMIGRVRGLIGWEDGDEWGREGVRMAGSAILH